MRSAPVARFAGLLVSVASLAASAPAQTPAPAKALKQLPASTNVALRLTDGSQVFGRLDRLDSDSVVIFGAAGRQAYPVGTVKDLRDAGVAHKTSDGSTEFWYPNANTTRLFFGPTGRTLKQGEGYFAVHEVVLASASVGITNRLQMGGGTFIIPNSEFWFILPKIGIVQSENVNIAAGAFYGGVGDFTGGIGYVVGTFGSTDRSVTAGIGRGISGDKVQGEPVFMLGGEMRTSRRVALVTENYFGTAVNDGLLMYGLRFLGEKFTVDLGFLNTVRDGLFPGVPYVDFVIKW